MPGSVPGEKESSVIWLVNGSTRGSSLIAARAWCSNLAGQSRNDNAMAESFVDTFKTELIADCVWRTRTQLELAIIRMGRLVQPRPLARAPIAGEE